jgi:serine/threonine protein kinase
MKPLKAPIKPADQWKGHANKDPESFGGKYRLKRLIGLGSVGTVHEADDLASGTTVALKLFHADVSRNDTLDMRFTAAARAASQLGHENVVGISDFGVSREGSPYVVMELLRGETLEALLARRGALPPTIACEIMVQILGGLTAAHRIGMVHRDLKPANVFITNTDASSPRVKLLEFGIATALEQRDRDVVLSAPLYMAPEQARGHESGPLTDVYAAGVVLYEMLAGEVPFSGDQNDVLSKVVAGQWRPLSSVNPAVPRLLALAVAAAMATDPSRRIGSARIFSKQLAPYLSHSPTHSAPQKNSAEAFLHGATSPLPEIKLMSSSDLPDPSRPPRDYPSLHLAKVAGKPRGEPLADSLLQSPIIPRAPMAPKIHIPSAIRDVEMWSNAPGAPGTSIEPAEPSEPPPASMADPEPVAFPVSEPAPAVDAAEPYDPVFDSMPTRQMNVVSAEVPPAHKGVWATALGIGVGALIAWLYRFG